jgi:hypothetical protein
VVSTVLDAVRWTGDGRPFLSITTRSAPIHGYGNMRIIHRKDVARGSARVLDEGSRFTPGMPSDHGWVDVGFTSAGRGKFTSEAVTPAGGMDIFAYDVVLRRECGTSISTPHTIWR